MERTHYNPYLFRALELYPYELAEATEALQFALSYDANNVQALCLMGKLHAEQLEDYEGAKEYFARAMASNLEMPGIYPDYILVMLKNEEHDEAQKLIDFAKTLKSTDKGNLFYLEGVLFEKRKVYKKALKAFENAKENGYNNDFISFIDGHIKRVKDKMPKKKNEQKNNKLKKGDKK